MITRPRALAFAALLALAARANVASADESTAGDALFEEGKTLLEAKDYAAACPKLAESHRLAPKGRTALALAICREGEGKTASAFAAYQEALFYAKRDKRKDREDVAAAKLIELEPLLPKLRVVVGAEARAQGVLVAIDRDPLKATQEGVPMPIDPGSHEISVSASGYVTHVETIVATPSKLVELDVGPLVAEKKSALPPPPPPPPTTTSGGTARTLGWVVGAVGLASTLVGGYFGLRAMSLGKDVDARCPASPCSDRSALDDNDRAHRYARVADVGILGGGALVAVGVSLVLFGGGSSATEKAPVVAVGKSSAFVRWEVSW